jgi:hypothetical protein
MAAAPPPDPVVLAPVDESLFPKGFEWRPVAAARLPVDGAVAAPAPVVRAVTSDRDGWTSITGFDMRQLALRVVPGPRAPRAVSGLPGTGRLAAGDADRLVAAAALVPTALASPGAVESGRVIAPLSPGAPRVAADEAGSASLLGASAFAPWGAVQTASPGDGEPVAAWCRTPAGALFVVAAEPPERRRIDAVLVPLGCRETAWVADHEPERPTPRTADLSGEGLPFAAWVRRKRFPEGRAERWTPSAGRQPEPAFEPAVLEHDEVVLGERVRVTAFVAERFSWAIRVGQRERSHRAGGAFPQADDALVARAVAAVDLGVGERRRPNGLTIGGSTGHAYGSRGAVLAASPLGLELTPSSARRDPPPVDGVELPLTATGGSTTPAARKRGLLQDRGDVCVLPDGTALVALARFDSHEATTEALLRLGCSEVAALDRGVDVAPGLARATAAPLPTAHPVTRLFALDPGTE